MAARAVGFFREAGELPSGVAAFDAGYQVQVLPSQIRQPPVDPSLADRILHWPADAVAPHSVLAWRDPYAFHVQARLPGPPNWAAVSYFVALADDFIARVLPSVTSSPPGFIDRLIDRFLRSSSAPPPWRPDPSGRREFPCRH